MLTTKTYRMVGGAKGVPQVHTDRNEILVDRATERVVREAKTPSRPAYGVHEIAREQTLQNLMRPGGFEPLDDELDYLLKRARRKFKESQATEPLALGIATEGSGRRRRKARK